jgi:hypothetical protein
MQVFAACDGSGDELVEVAIGRQKYIVKVRDNFKQACTTTCVEKCRCERRRLVLRGVTTIGSIVTYDEIRPLLQKHIIESLDAVTQWASMIQMLRNQVKWSVLLYPIQQIDLVTALPVLEVACCPQQTYMIYIQIGWDSKIQAMELYQSTNRLRLNTAIYTRGLELPQLITQVRDTIDQQHQKRLEFIDNMSQTSCVVLEFDAISGSRVVCMIQHHDMHNDKTKILWIDIVLIEWSAGWCYPATALIPPIFDDASWTISITLIDGSQQIKVPITNDLQEELSLRMENASKPALAFVCWLAKTLQYRGKKAEK